MSDFFGPASPGTMAVLGVALDVALKATVLIAAACAVHAVLGPRRALARSALWNACLVGLVLLPASSAAFPRLRLAVLAPPAEPAIVGATPAVATPQATSSSGSSSRKSMRGCRRSSTGGPSSCSPARGGWVETGVQDAYHVEAIPMTFLIGPDGKLLAAGRRGAEMSAIVAQALGTGRVLSSEEEDPL